MLYDEVGDKDAFEESAVKLKKKEAELKNYVDSHEKLHRRKDREQVVGFNKRISAETIAKNKFVDKYSSVKYNKDGTVVVTDNWKSRKHASIPKQYKKNAVIEVLEKKGNGVHVDRHIIICHFRRIKLC